MATQVREARGQFDPASLVKAIGNYSVQKRKIRDFLMEYVRESVDLESLSTGTYPTQTQTTRRGARRSTQASTVPSVPTIKSHKYRDAILKLSEGEPVLQVDVDDFLGYFGCPEGLYRYDPNGTNKATDVINTVLANTQRGLRLFYDVVEEVRKELQPGEQSAVESFDANVERQLLQATHLPTLFRVPYDVCLRPPAKQQSTPIHELRAEHVGTLLKVEGVISRVTTVRPCLRVAVYQCDDCGNLEFQHVDTPTFLPLADCTSQVCRAARRSDTLTMSMRSSKFVRRQEASLQELPHLVPSGTVPRQIKVVLYGALTHVLRPGMSVTVSGIFLPLLDGGYRHPQAPTACATVLEVHHIQPHRSAFDALNTECSETELRSVIAETPDLYERLAASIAPAIHGHDDVKKALLLQLVSGATEAFGDGLKIRGDIHILLMGDPGIAKSQLLLRVCGVAPRAHFTCGKGASGVGLTASVVKDPVTGEFTLEGGAIVLADNGICCVDEFDKMQESDRTAIHEVMEQQTVSISKAGLTATLNARTTILAAANPVFGRYDLTKSAVTNIGLPAALLSRFDIVFLLLDQGGNYEKDLRMARYLLQIHREKRVDQVEDTAGTALKPLTTPQIRSLIAKARQYVPKLDADLADAIADQYVLLRQRDRAERGGVTGENTYTTPRTLFAILRLSQAIARLRFSETISSDDFEEALRLMQASKNSVTNSRLVADAETTVGVGSADRGQVLAILQHMATDVRSGRSKWVSYKDAVRRVEQEGLPTELVEEIVDSMVHGGSMIWDGPAKLKFKQQLAGLASVEEEEDSSSGDEAHVLM